MSSAIYYLCALTLVALSNVWIHDEKINLIIRNGYILKTQNYLIYHYAYVNEYEMLRK